MQNITSTSEYTEQENVVEEGHEPHDTNINNKLNWLRAGVLGANDGIVSVAGTIIGVSGAISSTQSLMVAGVAALAAGAFSMAGGEYVSVSTQRDSEEALLRQEQWELDNLPHFELNELAQIYEQKGMSRTTAITAASEVMKNNALHAHAVDELGIDPDDLTNPWHAALSSFIAFVMGGSIPLLFAAIPVPFSARIALIIIAVALALITTGAVSAHLGGASKHKAILRNVTMGFSTMIFAWIVGAIFGVSGL